MFGISSTELVIVLVFGFLLFGPDKLPQMGRTIGRALRQFRETQEKLTAVVQTEVVDPMAAAAQAPVKPKKAADADAAKAEDEDADVAEGSASASEPVRKETFAERRARLAAEKARKEQAEEAGDDAAAPAAGKAAPDAANAAEPAAGASAEPEATEPVAEEEPEIRTTADLYARRPRKRKPAAAAVADEAPAVEGSVAEKASVADAPAASAEGGER